MNYAKLLFCNVDEEGNILPTAAFGKNVLPTEQYDFFFYLEEGFDEVDVLDFSSKYKVVLNGYKASLVMK